MMSARPGRVRRSRSTSRCRSRASDTAGSRRAHRRAAGLARGRTVTGGPDMHRNMITGCSSPSSLAIGCGDPGAERAGKDQGRLLDERLQRRLRRRARGGKVRRAARSGAGIYPFRRSQRPDQGDPHPVDRRGLRRAGHRRLHPRHPRRADRDRARDPDRGSDLRHQGWLADQIDYRPQGQEGRHVAGRQRHLRDRRSRAGEEFRAQARRITRRSAATRDSSWRSCSAATSTPRRCAP